MNRSLVFSALAILFTACATSSKAPSYGDAPHPVAKDGHALLYIYRIYAQPTAWPAYLQIDGREVASLNQEGFTWVYVKAGTHKFKYAWPALAAMPSVNFEHTLEAGQAYAFEMYGNASAYSGQTSEMKNVEIDVATQKMAGCCRYVPPKLKE